MLTSTIGFHSIVVLLGTSQYQNIRFSVVQLLAWCMNDRRVQKLSIRLDWLLYSQLPSYDNPFSDLYTTCNLLQVADTIFICTMIGSSSALQISDVTDQSPGPLIPPHIMTSRLRVVCMHITPSLRTYILYRKLILQKPAWIIISTAVHRAQ